jgi:dipeptidyl aminopeptidase/acylaminoacyl peptidase
VLLAHGDEDQVVPIRQSAEYAAALRKSGKLHEYHVYEGEGHGLANPENFADWLRRLEAFLDRHNPAE